MQIHSLNRFNTNYPVISKTKYCFTNKPELSRDTVSFGAHKTNNKQEKSPNIFNKIRNLFAGKQPVAHNSSETNPTNSKCSVIELKPTRITDVLDAKDIEYLKILDKLGDFTLEEYKNLTKNERKFLRDRYQKLIESKQGYISGGSHYSDGHYTITIREVAALHNKAVDEIKATLDEKYGEGKYGIIIIGRSLSSIGKCLGYRIGEENVINIPLSAADKYLIDKNIDTAKRYGSLDILKQFLSDNGLTKEKVKDPSKKYVILDYCYTGTSLKGAEKLLKSKYVFGECNIESMDVKNCIKNKYLCEHLDDTLCCSKFKELAFVKKCFELAYIKERVVSPKEFPSNYKLIIFKLLDNQVKKMNRGKKQNV